VTVQRDEFRVPKGAVIFRQGDEGHEMFVISAGRVRLTIGVEGHEKEVAVLGAGEFFGDLSLLSDAPRSATAEALEDSTLLAIGRDAFAMMVQDDLDIVFRMMNIQGQRLAHANEPIQDLTQRLDRVRIAAHCLKRLLTTNGQGPFVVSVRELASTLGIGLEAVGATVADLAQRGIGILQGDGWSIEGQGQVDKLVEALCTYAGRGR
jgi:CRP/FNR family transcriptional regulator, cyclic AMP receptor protein